MKLFFLTKHVETIEKYKKRYDKEYYHEHLEAKIYEIKITDFHTFYSLLLNKTNQWNYIMERIRKEIGENKYFDNFETTIFTSIL